MVSSWLAHAALRHRTGLSNRVSKVRGRTRLCRLESSEPAPSCRSAPVRLSALPRAHNEHRQLDAGLVRRAGVRALLAGRQQHDLRPGNQRDRARHGLLFRRQQQHAEPERVHGHLRQRRADHGRQRRFRARQRHERAGVEPVGGPQRGDRSQQLLSVGQPGLAVQQSHRNADRPLRSDRHPRGQLLLCGHHPVRNDQLQRRHLVGRSTA